MVKRIAAIVLVYLVATAGWIVLGGTITYRTDKQDPELRREVGELWGKPLTQRAPSGSLITGRTVVTETPSPTGGRQLVKQTTTVTETLEIPIVSNAIDVALSLDQRQKGLLRYSTYSVVFSGKFVFENPHDKDGDLETRFTLPSATGIYDDFRFELDGKPISVTRQSNDVIVARIPCAARSRHLLAINYKSQGLDRFMYTIGYGITEIRNFQFVARTNFDAYNHPGNTMSPSEPPQRSGNGWILTWKYSDLVSAYGIGIEMPQKIHPGRLAARISFFAPVSLGFFFFFILLISIIKKVDIHPVNYLFLSASFFAFHLLLAYMVDHVPILTAFVICSAVSIFLVASYMRAVVGRRLAYLEITLAQLIYLVGFSSAFFFEGLTGLAVTIGVIVTLFTVMQLTARINWSARSQLFGAAETRSTPPVEMSAVPAIRTYFQ